MKSGVTPDEDEGRKEEEISENVVAALIESYWSGEAPKKIIEREKSRDTSPVTKDW